MMVLVDTSVWIDHFRLGNQHLSELLNAQRVLVHPIVIGELSSGNLQNREATFSDLQALPHVNGTQVEESLYFLEAHRLYGRGLSWNDIQLLASAVIEGVILWSLDKRLDEAAGELGHCHQEKRRF